MAQEMDGRPLRAVLPGFLIALLLIQTARSAAAEPMTWEDAVRTARGKNPEVLSADHSRRAAQAAARVSYGDFFPDLAANGGDSDSDAGSGEYSASLSLRQTLFSGFSTLAGTERARAQFEGANADYDLTEARVASDLKKAFAGLLAAQENLALTEMIRDRRAENRRLIELRFEAGRENRGSFLRATAQESQARCESDRDARDLGLSRRTLARAMGMDDFDALAATGTLRLQREAPAAEPSRLVAQTPAYRKQFQSLLEARAELKGARSGFFPSLSVSGTGQKRGRDFPPDNASWSAGLSLSYPLFSGGKDFFGVRRAGEDLSRSQKDLENVKRQTGLSLDDAYQGLVNAVQSATVQKEFLAAARERAEISRAQYTTGLLSYQDWDQIETDLIDSQKRELAAARDAAAAEAEWEKIQGKGFIE